MTGQEKIDEALAILKRHGLDWFDVTSSGRVKVIDALLMSEARIKELEKRLETVREDMFVEINRELIKQGQATLNL